MIRWAVAALLVAGCTHMENRNLIWSDEFEGGALDASKWTPAHDCWGGGNEERQCYAPANVTVEDGLLRLTARRETAHGPALPESMGGGEAVIRDYSSGRIDTRGKASFRYGRIEVRAKLPPGQGLWSAIWMLPEHDNYGPYPLSGEIDIAEAVNLGVDGESRVHGAVHHGTSVADHQQIGGAAALPDPDAFHIYALDWSPASMTWSVDGRPYFSQPTPRPFDQRFHLILNLAVGGRWPESVGRGGVDDASLPATMLIDWVRVYA